MPKARARHILVKEETVCLNLKQRIEAGASFADIASKHSLCPSGKKGGDLGEFSRGQMVREFDEVVFTQEIGKPLGPVKTQFGYHLILIESRS